MNKKKFFLVSIFLAVVLIVTCIIFMNDGADARTSYTLVCRGGGSMRATFDMPQQYHTSGPKITIGHFIQSEKPASVQLPEPGKCAWTDRPFNREEPTFIDYITSNPGLHFIEFQSGSVKRWRFNDQVQYILDAVVSGNVFYLQVYRDRNVFKVTHVGP